MNRHLLKPILVLLAVLIAISVSRVQAVTSVQVQASLPEDSTKQTKYNVTISNTGTTSLSGFSARIYVDLTEIFAAGRSASDVVCDERYDPTGTATCTLKPFSGNIYYANLDFGSYTLAAGSNVTYKVTLRLSDYAQIWDSSNDYSHFGLTGTDSVTTRIPVYQGATRIYGTDPGGATATPIPPTATATPVGPTATRTSTPVPPTATRTPTPVPPTATATPSGSCSTPRTVNVSTAAQLTSALSGAQPGDTINLAAGTYTGNFVATMSGTSTCHIILTGPSTAILDSGNNSSGYVFHLQASYWELRGFTARNAQKGIVTDGANNNLLDGVTVKDVGMEGVHFRAFSSNNTIQNSTVTNTGLVNAGFGEGIYIGSANSNWCTYSNCNPDTSNNNKVLNNHLGPNIRAEPMDIKEGTTGGLIDGNYLDATGISGQNFADSWIDVKGNSYTLSNNTGVNPNNNTIFVDGMQVHQAVSGWGNNNTFKLNNLDVRSSGYGFNVQSGTTGNVVCTNNTVTNAAKGVANIALTTCP